MSEIVLDPPYGVPPVRMGMPFAQAVDVSVPEEPVVLGLTIVFSRWTSQEVPLDPVDGLPRYFTAALVSREDPGFWARRSLDPLGWAGVPSRESMITSSDGAG